MAIRQGSGRSFAAARRVAPGAAVLIAAAATGSAWAGDTAPKVVYGRDDRVEVGMLTGRRAANALATVALVDELRVVANGDGTSRLVAPNLGQSYNLCPDQRFRAQPTASFCSGFLARPDRVVTAGHCINQFNLTTTRFVFGYRVSSDGKARTKLANSDIYRGVQLITSREGDGQDFAVVRLDRKVVGRVPALIQTWNVPLRLPVYVIGHPSGLPAKFSGGANIQANARPSIFSANLDTFGGDSGAPVFNASNDRVVGILVSGAADYRDRKGCNVVNILANAAGEENATRIGLVRPFLGHPPPAGGSR